MTKVDLETHDRIDYLARQVLLLTVGFVAGMAYMNERLNDIEERLNGLGTAERFVRDTGLSLRRPTGPSIPSGTEDSEHGTAELSAVEYGE